MVAFEICGLWINSSTSPTSADIPFAEKAKMFMLFNMIAFVMMMCYIEKTLKNLEATIFVRQWRFGDFPFQSDDPGLTK
jgi:hypothetical protein